jgi:uncharacterized integral membrane protein (TIGR00697 family)
VSGTIERRSFRYFDLVMAAFVAVLLISNIASAAKIVTFGLPFLTFDGGTLLFPLSYIFGDILTEVYGYHRSRRVIWVGFFCTALMSLTLWVVGRIPGEVEWSARVGQQAYDAVLGSAPRIVLASLVAYFAGEFSNSYVLAKMKLLTHGRWLWTRTIGSTVVGEGVDTLLFVAIAFAGTMSWAVLFSICVSNYLFKTGLEVIMTPVTYRVVSFLKRAENEDYYDYGTDFNPFRAFAGRKGEIL